ncbi:hypothetical protein MMC18_001290 [Xylographa bjoerkii]|nr:hypothetical protein [Xylographa bjoerkii]
MSKVKGISGLVLATVFGVLNGVAIFGPALKDRELQKLEHTSSTDEAITSVDQQNEGENTTKPSIVLDPNISELASASPAAASAWSFPKLQDWNTFWMEGDRALKQKTITQKASGLGSFSDSSKNTTEDVIIASDSVHP